MSRMTASYLPKISVMAVVTPGLSSPEILIKIISLLGIIFLYMIENTLSIVN
jgi:hypothetical protein